MEFIGSTLERLASDNNEYEFVPMPIDGVAELGVSLVTVCDNLNTSAVHPSMHCPRTRERYYRRISN